MDRHSERHQLAVRVRRAALAVAAGACALAVCAELLLGRGCSGSLPPAGEVEAGETSGPAGIGGVGGAQRVALPGRAEGDAADAGLEGSAAAVPEAAAELVYEYEQRGDCVLVRSGYLDLSGRVWSMVVEGSGWVDVCIVQSAGSGVSETKVMHMDVEEWEASLDELGLGG